MPTGESGQKQMVKAFISNERGGNGENRKEVGPNISGLNMWRHLKILRVRRKGLQANPTSYSAGALSLVCAFLHAGCSGAAPESGQLRLFPQCASWFRKVP